MRRHIRGFCACSARISNSINDVRQTNKRESGPKPATSAHVGRVLALTALVFNELAYGFRREHLNEANEIFSRILLVVQLAGNFS